MSRSSKKDKEEGSASPVDDDLTPSRKKNKYLDWDTYTGQRGREKHKEKQAQREKFVEDFKQLHKKVANVSAEKDDLLMLIEAKSETIRQLESELETAQEADGYSSIIANLKEEISVLQKRNLELEKEMANLCEERDVLQVRVQDLDRSISMMDRKEADLKEELELKTMQIEDLKRSVDMAKEMTEKLQDSCNANLHRAESLKLEKASLEHDLHALEHSATLSEFSVSAEFQDVQSILHELLNLDGNVDDDKLNDCISKLEVDARDIRRKLEISEKQSQNWVQLVAAGKLAEASLSLGHSLRTAAHLLKEVSRLGAEARRAEVLEIEIGSLSRRVDELIQENLDVVRERAGLQTSTDDAYREVQRLQTLAGDVELIEERLSLAEESRFTLEQQNADLKNREMVATEQLQMLQKERAELQVLLQQTREGSPPSGMPTKDVGTVLTPRDVTDKDTSMTPRDLADKDTYMTPRDLADKHTSMTPRELADKHTSMTPRDVKTDDPLDAVRDTMKMSREVAIRELKKVLDIDFPIPMEMDFDRLILEVSRLTNEMDVIKDDAQREKDVLQDRFDRLYARVDELNSTDAERQQEANRKVQQMERRLMDEREAHVNALKGRRDAPDVMDVRREVLADCFAVMDEVSIALKDGSKSKTKKLSETRDMLQHALAEYNMDKPMKLKTSLTKTIESLHEEIDIEVQKRVELEKSLEGYEGHIKGMKHELSRTGQMVGSMEMRAKDAEEARIHMDRAVDDMGKNHAEEISKLEESNSRLAEQLQQTVDTLNHTNGEIGTKMDEHRKEKEELISSLDDARSQLRREKETTRKLTSGIDNLKDDHALLESRLHEEHAVSLSSMQRQVTVVEDEARAVQLEYTKKSKLIQDILQALGVQDGDHTEGAKAAILKIGQMQNVGKQESSSLQLENLMLKTQIAEIEAAKNTVEKEGLETIGELRQTVEAIGQENRALKDEVSKLATVVKGGLRIPEIERLREKNKPAKRQDGDVNRQDPGHGKKEMRKPDPRSGEKIEKPDLAVLGDFLVVPACNLTTKVLQDKEDVLEIKKSAILNVLFPRSEPMGGIAEDLRNELLLRAVRHHGMALPTPNSADAIFKRLAQMWRFGEDLRSALLLLQPELASRSPYSETTTDLAKVFTALSTMDQEIYSLKKKCQSYKFALYEARAASKLQKESVHDEINRITRKCADESRIRTVAEEERDSLVKEVASLRYKLRGVLGPPKESRMRDSAPPPTGIKQKEDLNTALSRPDAPRLPSVVELLKNKKYSSNDLDIRLVGDFMTSNTREPRITGTRYAITPEKRCLRVS